MDALSAAADAASYGGGNVSVEAITSLVKSTEAMAQAMTDVLMASLGVGANFSASA